jgi:1-aminocyclopropane-1-carboxylate deaminase/D-cysteine desulfhydrase-like pyridoxal-dependent ACC family enzyme
MHIPFGAIAYIEAFLELYEQAIIEKIKIDSIVLATGSGSTQAGLLVGAKILSPKTKIIGISVSEDKETMKKYIKIIADHAFSEMNIKKEIEYEDIIVFDDYLKEGYGILNREVTQAISLLAREEGILLDPVYTGKAMVGMIDLIEKGYFEEGENIIFLHTGGNPALFPYKDKIISFLKENT